MSETLQQFREWSVGAGQVANPNGTYPGQCVSLIQEYLWLVFGVPYAARGNACDFVPPTFTKLAPNAGLRPGDIIRYGKNFGGGYGHIGLIDDDGQFLNQNGGVPLRVEVRAKPFNGIESVWRPTKSFTVKTPAPAAPAASSTLPLNIRVARPGKATVTVDALHVRAAPNIDSALVATYAKGQQFTYDSYIIANGYVWLSYIAHSGARRYVAQGPYDGNPNNNWLNGGI